MESSLHRQLKSAYASEDAEQEVRLSGYRIDVVDGRRLIEIQHGSLAAIRDKLRRLLPDHPMLVVKPIVQHKQLVKLDRKDGQVVSRRASPKRGTLLDLFDDLVYMTRVFPHPNLELEVPLVRVEEWRYPGHGRRRRRRSNDFQVADQKLVEIETVHRFRTNDDLLALLPARLPSPFHTGHLSEKMGVPRWVAQRIAYCLREMGGLIPAGKQGNTRLYHRPRKKSSRNRRGSAQTSAATTPRNNRRRAS